MARALLSRSAKTATSSLDGTLGLLSDLERGCDLGQMSWSYVDEDHECMQYRLPRSVNWLWQGERRVYQVERYAGKIWFHGETEAPTWLPQLRIKLALYCDNNIVQATPEAERELADMRRQEHEMELEVLRAREAEQAEQAGHTSGAHSSEELRTRRMARR